MALIDVKVCFYDNIYNIIRIRALEYVEIGKRDGSRAAEKGGKPGIVVLSR